MLGNSSSSGDPLGNMTKYESSVVVAAIPTFSMIIGSMLVVYCRPTEIVKACLQNLSAGIILAVSCCLLDRQNVRISLNITHSLPFWMLLRSL